ncbi:MAG: hypothetical protein WC765_03045 [Phycisphaerae bacterium]
MENSRRGENSCGRVIGQFLIAGHLAGKLKSRCGTANGFLIGPGATRLLLKKRTERELSRHAPDDELAVGIGGALARPESDELRFFEDFQAGGRDEDLDFT